MKRHRSPSSSSSGSSSRSSSRSLSRSISPQLNRDKYPHYKRFRSPSPDPYEKHKFYFCRAFAICFGIFYIYDMIYG